MGRGHGTASPATRSLMREDVALVVDATLSVIQERLAQEDNPDEWWVYDGMCCIWCGGTGAEGRAAHQPGCALADLLGSR